MLFKNFLILIVTILTINHFFGALVYAGTGNEKKAEKRAEKLKTKISKIGTGKDVLVKVKLSDGTKLKGYISRTADDNFVVTDAETGKSTTVPYNRAKQVSSGSGGRCNWLCTVGVTAGVILLIALL